MSARLMMRLMMWITFINASIGIALGGLLYTLWPAHYFAWYPSIPIFYWLTAMIMAYVLERKKKKKGDVTITTYMLVRLSRFVLAVFFLWIYAEVVNERMKMFGFTMMLFYFIYLSLETYMIYLYEKKRMKREKRENEERSQN